MGTASQRRGDRVISQQAAGAAKVAIARQGRPARTVEAAPAKAATPAPTRSQIAAWMQRNAADYRDKSTGEINLTAMVEGWDSACADGGATLDPDHIAWDIAVSVAERAGGLT